MTDETFTPNKPTAIDIEVAWDKNQIIVSKSDLFGTIDYANEAFANVSGYEEYELVGKPHSLIRHPDMPKIIYKILWDNLKLGKSFRIILKNLAKSGEYYWVISDFEYNKDSEGNVIEYISRRNSITNEIIENEIAPLYKKLLLIEQASGLKYSEKYLIGFLEEKGLSFEDYTFSLLNTENKTAFSEKTEVVENIIEPENSIEPEIIQEVEVIKIVEQPEIIETVKVIEKVIEEEIVEDLQDSKEDLAIENVVPTKETVEIEQIIDVQDSKPVDDLTKINNEPKAEVKKQVLETTDFSSSEFEEVQRETRSGFIGKLFGRE